MGSIIPFSPYPLRIEITSPFPLCLFWGDGKYVVEETNPLFDAKEYLNVFSLLARVEVHSLSVLSPGSLNGKRIRVQMFSPVSVRDFTGSLWRH